MNSEEINRLRKLKFNIKIKIIKCLKKNKDPHELIDNYWKYDELIKGKKLKNHNTKIYYLQPKFWEYWRNKDIKETNKCDKRNKNQKIPKNVYYLINISWIEYNNVLNNDKLNIIEKIDKYLNYIGINIINIDNKDLNEKTEYNSIYKYQNDDNDNINIIIKTLEFIIKDYNEKYKSDKILIKVKQV